MGTVLLLGTLALSSVSDTNKGHSFATCRKNHPMLHRTRSLKLRKRYTMENPTYMPRMPTHYGMGIEALGPGVT